MLKTRILTDRNEIDEVMPRCIELARKTAAVLPFHYMHLPFLWWDNFHSSNGSFFGEKRGKNFLGAQSRLDAIHLFISEENGEICGATPFVTFCVKIRGRQENLRILSFAGDYVAIPYQDFLVLPSKRAPVLSSILEKLMELFSNGHDLLFIGYVPENSLNLALIRNVISSIQNSEIHSIESVLSRKGGVWPWTLAPHVDSLIKLCDKTGRNEEAHRDLQALVAKLSDCKPQNLLFPRTRNRFESAIQSALEKIIDEEAAAADIRRITALLNPVPILYPLIILPGDRESFFSTLSKGTRRYFRRYKKRFLNAGGSFEKITPDAMRDSDVDDYIHLHVLRWGKESAAICDTSAGFHKYISMSMAKEGLFTLFFARYQGKRIAAHSAFDIHPRREGYLTGRDPEYSELRAGRLLYQETIYDAIDNGFDIYDLGAVDFDYKMSFTEKFTTARNFFISHKPDVFDLSKLFLGYECMEQIRIHR